MLRCTYISQSINNSSEFKTSSNLAIRRSQPSLMTGFNAYLGPVQASMMMLFHEETRLLVHVYKNKITKSRGAAVNFGGLN